MKLALEMPYRMEPPRPRGSNHHGRRIIEAGDFAAHSPFLLLSEDWFAPPAGFPAHPHRGMETVTFVLEGQLEHKDHTGAHGVIDAGGIQFMTAGRGVIHSEMPGPQGVHTLQLWLNLPARLKRTAAQYKDLHLGDAPLHREAGVEARLYAGRLGLFGLPHGSTWPITIIDLRLEAGAAYDLPLPGGQRVFTYILEGHGDVGENRRDVAADMAAFAALSPGADREDHLAYRARTVLRALVYASPTIDEPVVAGGPFVANTEAELIEAFDDFRAGRLTEPAD